MGAALGPVLAASFMTMTGPGGLFLFIAVCAGLAMAVGLWRQRASDPVPGNYQQEFQVVPRTTPMASLLDPNVSDDEPAAG